MCSKKFFVRFLPFFAALFIGIFIASFFVTIGRPGFGPGRRYRHFEEDRQIRMELDRLRDENQRLKSQMNDLKMNASDDWMDRDIQLPVPPPPPVAPVRPLAPRAIR